MACPAGRASQVSHGTGRIASTSVQALAICALLLVTAISGATSCLASEEQANRSAKSDPTAITGSLREPGASVDRIGVPLHKSRTLELDSPFSSAVVGAPSIADVLPMSDSVLYIQGKQVGTTNVSVFDKNKRLIAIVDIDVTIDTQHIMQSIRSSIESTGIRISGANNKVIRPHDTTGILALGRT